MVPSNGFRGRRYAGKDPSKSFSLNNSCSNVDNFDQSGNGPEMGPRDIINTASLDKKDSSCGRVPLILFDDSPFGAATKRR